MDRIDKLPNSENAFQLEITSFSSKKALVSIPNKPGGVVNITNKPVALDEVLTQAGLAVDGASITRVKLKRGADVYQFTLNSLLNELSAKVQLFPDDRVIVDFLPYKPNKVFVLGGVTPSIITIDPAKRETLADILFTPNGVLAAANAKRSEVYLLRGSNPIYAYRLDAQSPARLIVADAMELRPKDILFVAEQDCII